MSDHPIASESEAVLVPAQQAYDAALDELRAFEIARPSPPASWPVPDRHRYDDLAAACTSALLHLHMLRVAHDATSHQAVRRIQHLAARPQD